MSKLSTKGVKTGGVSKTLVPGNIVAKINNVELEEFKFKEGGYHLVMNMEGEDLGADFEGFYINKDKPELGRHKGPVGKVKAGEWAFADGETKSGIKVSRDQDIMKFMKQLCTSLGCIKWFDDQDNKHDNIESLVKAFNKDKPFKDVFMRYCLAGKEYKSKAGYDNYELFLPKWSKSGVPYEALDVEPSKIAKFNDTEHVKRKKVEIVNDFGTEGGTDIITGGNELDL